MIKYLYVGSVECEEDFFLCGQKSLYCHTGIIYTSDFLLHTDTMCVIKSELLEILFSKIKFLIRIPCIVIGLFWLI